MLRYLEEEQNYDTLQMEYAELQRAIQHTGGAHQIEQAFAIACCISRPENNSSMIPAVVCIPPGPEDNSFDDFSPAFSPVASSGGGTKRAASDDPEYRPPSKKSHKAHGHTHVHARAHSGDHGSALAPGILSGGSARSDRCVMKGC